MTKIVDLQTYRDKALEQRSFGPWQRRFLEIYRIPSRLSDLSDKTLYYLALPGDNSSTAFYELIMGVCDLGAATKFHYLDNKEQLRVVDIHLFLADQVRFELMHRLGWLKRYATQNHALVEIVRKSEELKAAAKTEPPLLAETHTGYGEYQKLTGGDKEVFIRRLLQEALEIFQKRLEE